MPDRYGEPRPGRDETPDETPATDATPDPDTDPWAEAHARQHAIDNCNLCNTDGYRGTTVCDHTDHTQAAKRGIAHIRAIMGWQPPPPHHTPETA